MFLGDGNGFFQTVRANAPGRSVDNAQQPQIIRRVCQDAEIAEHVLDLGPVKELHAAVDPVGDAAALECVFQLV